jgi:hypothetical protein
MTTSSNTSFPQRLTKIDELTRGDHTYLEGTDECLFFGDYTARKGFAFSPTNNLVLNFKKPLKNRNKPGWHYKARAVEAVATAFSDSLGGALAAITLVPIPPSKLRTDPEYDDRLMEMLRKIRPSVPLSMPASTQAAMSAGLDFGAVSPAVMSVSMYPA